MGYRKPYYNEDHKLVRYGINDAIKDSVLFFRNFFAWRNIHHAFAGVIKGVREFLGFYIVLLIVQSLFWMVWFIADTRADAIREEALREYDWNVTIEGLSNDEWTELYNSTFLIADERSENERGYVSYTTSQYYIFGGETRYRLCFLLVSDSIDSADSFIKKYSFDKKDHSISYTERTNYHIRIGNERRTAVFITIALGVLSSLIVLVLFIIRTNQYKFTYGIYMSFGAGFEKLVETAAWELSAVAVLTFIPAIILSAVIFLTCFHATGIFILVRSVFKPGRLFSSIIWTLAIVFASVIPSVKILSVQSPIKLLSAQDNSNYVSSPRRSFHIFNKKFPINYELYSFVRFRNYYGAVIVSSVLIVTLFFSGLAVADMRFHSEQYSKPQFRAVTEDAIDLSDIEILDELEGMHAVSWETSVSASQCRSHLVLTPKQASGIASHTVSSQMKDMLADNSFKYVQLDESLINEAGKGIWDLIDGNLESILNTPNTIGISGYISNKLRLNIQVGDKVTIAKFNMQALPVDYTKTDKKYILNRQIENYYFDYIEVTIGAVLDIYDTSDDYSVIVSPDLFETVTGSEGKISSLFLYFDSDATYDEIKTARERIISVLSKYNGFELIDTNQNLEQYVNHHLSTVNGILYFSYSVLIVAPLIILNSQYRFWLKRERELYLLSAIGGRDKRIFQLSLLSGTLLTISVSLSICIFTSLFGRLIFRALNEFMPSLGFGDGIRYAYHFQLAGVFVGITVSVAAVFISVIMAFVKITKRRYRSEIDQ